MISGVKRHRSAGLLSCLLVFSSLPFHAWSRLLPLSSLSNNYFLVKRAPYCNENLDNNDQKAFQKSVVGGARNESGPLIQDSSDVSRVGDQLGKDEIDETNNGEDLLANVESKEETQSLDYLSEGMSKASFELHSGKSGQPSDSDEKREHQTCDINDIAHLDDNPCSRDSFDEDIMSEGTDGNKAEAPLEVEYPFSVNAKNKSRVEYLQEVEAISAPRKNIPQKIRSTSDFLLDLVTRSVVDISIQSQELRELISAREFAYLEELYDNTDISSSLPHPRKLLHYLAPKIPAIKHSPDVMLEIKSARSDIDPGIAACLIGTLGHVCEVYEVEYEARASQSRENTSQSPEPRSIVADILRDRRFEQLIECVRCGINVNGRSKEYYELEIIESNNSIKDDIEEVLKVEDAQYNEGLSIRDSCRAAWGISVLGAYRLGILGDSSMLDLLKALAMRSRELLLARLQQLQQGDLYNEVISADISVDERIMVLSEELAEDAATAIWTFAAVHACTNLTFHSLFDVCSSILCQDPYELRRRAQSMDMELGSNDIVERLALSESIISRQASSDERNSTQGSWFSSRDALLDWLSPKEMVDVVWALAVHGTKSPPPLNDEKDRTDTIWAFREVAFDRAMSWLRMELDFITSSIQSSRGMIESASGSKSLTSLPVMIRHGESSRPGVSSEYRLEQGSADPVLIGASDTEAMHLPGAEIETRPEYNVKHFDNDYESSYAGDLVDPEPPLDTDKVAEVVVTEAVSEDQDDVFDVKMLFSEDELGLEAIELMDASSVIAAEEASHTTAPSEKYTCSDKEELATTQIQPIHPLMLHDPCATEGADEMESDLNLSATFPLVMHDVMVSDADRASFAHLCDLKYFDVHELCTLAWSVVELHDPLRCRMMNVLLNLFFNLGPERLKDLSGGDLSNFAWSIAKYTTECDKSANCQEIALVIVSWIADEVYLWSAEESNLLKRFSPSEFSKLLWAIATVNMARVDGTRLAGTGDELSYVGLMTSTSNLDIFGTEDLARLLWAFLCLSRSKDVLTLPSAAMAFGKIMACIESSLLHWENCKLNSQRDGIVIPESNRFSSFFGRWFHIPFIYHRLDDYTGDAEEVMSEEGQEKNRVRDLALDPFTLCKLCSSVEKLLSRKDGIMAPEILTKTALKLFTSKNGRLLRTCPIHDLIRICEAAALTDVSSKRELVNRFVRLLVHHLNVADIEGYFLSPGDSSTLIWSLGELGVKYKPTSNRNDISAHQRKLQLTAKLPFLDQTQLVVLSSLSVKNMLRGLARMNVVTTDKEYVIEFLSFLELRVSSFTDAVDLCDLIHSLCLIKSISDASINEYYATITEVQQNVTKDANSTFIEHMNEPILDLTVQRLCGNIISLISSRLADFASDMTLNSMHELLMALTLLPLRADELVNRIESEVEHRNAMLQSLSNVNMENSIQEFFSTISELNERNAGNSDSEPAGSRLAVFKNGLKSFFGSSISARSPDRGEPLARDDFETNPTLNNDLKHMHETIEVMLEMTRRLEIIQAATKSSMVNAIANSSREAIFDIGRCRELIDQYRSIDFSTGKKARHFNQRNVWAASMRKRLFGRRRQIMFP